MKMAMLAQFSLRTQAREPGPHRPIMDEKLSNAGPWFSCQGEPASAACDWPWNPAMWCKYWWARCSSEPQPPSFWATRPQKSLDQSARLCRKLGRYASYRVDFKPGPQMSALIIWEWC